MISVKSITDAPSVGGFYTAVLVSDARDMAVGRQELEGMSAISLLEAAAAQRGLRGGLEYSHEEFFGTDPGTGENPVNQASRTVKFRPA
jgi:hypothetical protein